MTGGAWYLLEQGRLEAACNMALDEALLELAPAIGRPVLRFYGWSEPAASFGYSQHYAEIERWTRLRPLVRRPTGGGLVPHDADWTYSVAIPPGDSWYQLAASESYRRIHEWIGQAFARIEVPTSLAPAARKDVPGQCFVGAEKFDLLWQGRKIAGAAQRRTHNGLLIQGSVQPPPIGLERSEWQNAMGAAAACDWSRLDLTGKLAERAQFLAATKYSQSTYNQKR